MKDRQTHREMENRDRDKEIETDLGRHRDGQRRETMTENTLCTLCMTLIPGPGCVPTQETSLAISTLAETHPPSDLASSHKANPLQCPEEYHLPSHHQASFLAPPGDGGSTHQPRAGPSRIIVVTGARPFPSVSP